MKLSLLTCAAAALLASGCATVGAPFQFAGPATLTKGKTTKADIIARYGKPLRVGYEDGNEKWTYGYYKYRLFGDSDTKDFAITFAANGTILGYSYSSSDPSEVAGAAGKL